MPAVTLNYSVLRLSNYAVTSFIVVFIIKICRNKFNILKAKTLFI